MRQEASLIEEEGRGLAIVFRGREIFQPPRFTRSSQRTRKILSLEYSRNMFKDSLVLKVLLSPFCYLMILSMELDIF